MRQSLQAPPPRQREPLIKRWVYGVYIMTSWHGNAFRITSPLCGESIGHDGVIEKAGSLCCMGDVMEMLSTLLALGEGGPPVTGKFPSQRTCNAKLWWFRSCWLECVIEQTVKLPVNWDVTLMLRHYSGDRGATAEIWVLISNVIPHLADVITDQCRIKVNPCE